jgi:tRNA (guanine-N7-)-methyltransferase
MSGSGVDQDRIGQRPRTFKPRRRSLSASRQGEFQRLMRAWAVEVEGPLLDVHGLFGRTGPVVLDIGIGHGEATVALALARPDELVLAADVHTPGIARVLDEIEAHGLTNLRVVHGDVLDVLPRLAAGSLAGVRIFFPDPWPKRRQQHRRIVSPPTVTALVDRLVVGGTLHVATDVEDYAVQVERVCAAEPRLRGGRIPRPDRRPVTRFELAAHAAARTPVDLVYERSRPTVSDTGVQLVMPPRPTKLRASSLSPM